MTPHPFDYLSQLDALCRQRVARHPTPDEGLLSFRGLSFRVAAHELLAPMEEIAEIVTPPQLTRVPSVKPWALGIGNMRGNLLPVMDLQGFLLGENVVLNPRRQRLLVVQHAGVYVGLLVEAVIGMKRFREKDRLAQVPTVADAPRLQAFLVGAYQQAEQHYPVFSPWRLVRHTDFLNISA